MPSSLILELLYPGSVDARVWLDAFTPILSKQYWYFSSYFVLFLFMPFLKQLIHALDAVRLRQLAVTLVLCFSLLPLFMSGDVFSVASGYSPLWLIALYLLGACLRRLDGERRGRRRYLLWYLLAVTAAWAGKLALDAWNLSGSPPIPHFNSMLVLSYLSPFILLGSLALVRFFSGVRLSSQIGRLVGVLSSASPLSLHFSGAPVYIVTLIQMFQFRYVNPIPLFLVLIPPAIHDDRQHDIQKKPPEV